MSVYAIEYYYNNTNYGDDDMRFRSIPVNDILQECMKTDGIIIDVRSFPEFRQGHIPMAVNIPVETIEQGQFSLPKSKFLFVYCRYGGSSSYAARILANQGYKVVNTTGGISQYKGALAKGH